MAEWLILLLLVPAVVVPVVLLVGFAGCDRVFGFETLHPPETTFDETDAFSRDASGWEGFTLVQRIEPAGLTPTSRTFLQVTITLFAATRGGHFAAPTFELAAFGVGAGGWTSDNIYPRGLADVSGDHLTDIVGFAGNGVWQSMTQIGPG